MWSHAWIPGSCLLRSCISASCCWLISLREAFSISNYKSDCDHKRSHSFYPRYLSLSKTQTHTKCTNILHSASAWPILWSLLLFLPRSWHLEFGSASEGVQRNGSHYLMDLNRCFCQLMQTWWFWWLNVRLTCSSSCFSRAAISSSFSFSTTWRFWHRLKRCTSESLDWISEAFRRSSIHCTCNTHAHTHGVLTTR